MDDLISRKALKKAIAVARTNYNTCPEYNELFKYFSDLVGAMIDEMPAVDAEPVRHGIWIFRDDDLLPDYMCSLCKYTSIYTGGTKYCPNCGAKMDMEREDE